MNTTDRILVDSPKLDDESEFSKRFEAALGLARAATTSFDERDTSFLTHAIEEYVAKYGNSDLTKSMLKSSKYKGTWPNWLNRNQLTFINSVLEAFQSGEIEPYSLVHSVMKGLSLEFSLKNPTDQNRQVIDAIAVVVDRIFEKSDVYDHVSEYLGWTDL
tara:strand:- start:3617 stop:4096 length:480 start_codon:yes stop_codon:yes gene_type:complete